jgi:hypothetical protein
MLLQMLSIGAEMETSEKSAGVKVFNLQKWRECTMAE